MSLSELQIKLNIQQIRNAGTFAEVYLADTLDLNGKQRTAAVKILKEKWNDNLEILQRFQDEANLLKNLSHPNILQVDGLIEIENRAGILMEFIDGIDLKQILKALREPLPQAVGFEIAAKIADALHNAYAVSPPNHNSPLRVIHRDIKPSNVMLSSKGGVKILDFGASFFLSTERNASTQMFQFGSQKYMPPERKQGERGSHKADVYSLGITLIEMFSRRKVNVLPTEKKEHDRLIKSYVMDIPIKLPSSVWEERARETIIRMCSYEKKYRITADQAKGMLIPFYQNSEGPTLSSFSKSHIAPLARRAFTNSTGTLSGIVIDTRPEEHKAQYDTQPQQKAGSTTFPLPNIEQELRGQNRETLVNSTHKDKTQKTASGSASPLLGNPVGTPTKSSNGIHTIAFLTGLLGSTLLTMIALAMVNSGFRHLAKANTQEASDEDLIESATQEKQSKTQGKTVSSESDIKLTQDESFRYVKLSSADGTISYRISNSSPQKTATVPNGTYELRYKSRPTAGIPIDKTIDLVIEQSTEVHCRLDTEIGIGCFNANGELLKENSTD